MQVCPGKEITFEILFFADGIGTQNVLFDREVFGLLGYMCLISSLFIGICIYICIYYIGIILAHEKRCPK